MTWKLTAWAKTRSPATGIPWRDLSDAEFEALEIEHHELRDLGYFEHERIRRPAASPAEPELPTVPPMDAEASVEPSGEETT